MEDQNKHHISGYVANVSPLKISKAKRSYFEFGKQNSTNQLQTVCFSPEKRRVIESIPTDEYQNIGCELVNFKKSDNGDMLVIIFTSVKRMKLNFEKQSLIASYSTVNEIVNKKPINAMANAKETIFNLQETEQKVCENSKMLQITKVVFKLFRQHCVKNLQGKWLSNNKPPYVPFLSKKSIKNNRNHINNWVG